ncbi:hypothetical protein Tco_0712833 [Tanacetum coccineum]
MGGVVGWGWGVCVGLVLCGVVGLDVWWARISRIVIWLGIGDSLYWEVCCVGRKALGFDWCGSHVGRGGEGGGVWGVVVECKCGGFWIGVWLLDEAWGVGFLHVYLWSEWSLDRGWICRVVGEVGFFVLIGLLDFAGVVGVEGTGWGSNVEVWDGCGLNLSDGSGIEVCCHCLSGRLFRWKLLRFVMAGGLARIESLIQVCGAKIQSSIMIRVHYLFNSVER